MPVVGDHIPVPAMGSVVSLALPARGANMTDLVQRVMEMAAVWAHDHVDQLGVVIVLGETRQIVVRLPLGELVIGQDQEAEPARRSTITAGRGFALLIALIAFLLLQIYTELPPEDQNLLIAALAIAGAAGWVYDHYKPVH